jgi:hypothetical protein
MADAAVTAETHLLREHAQGGEPAERGEHPHREERHDVEEDGRQDHRRAPDAHRERHQSGAARASRPQAQRPAEDPDQGGVQRLRVGRGRLDLPAELVPVEARGRAEERPLRHPGRDDRRLLLPVTDLPSVDAYRPPPEAAPRRQEGSERGQQERHGRGPVDGPAQAPRQDGRDARAGDQDLSQADSRPPVPDYAPRHGLWRRIHGGILARPGARRNNTVSTGAASPEAGRTRELGVDSGREGAAATPPPRPARPSGSPRACARWSARARRRPRQLADPAVEVDEAM